jgi:hypothetical protein
MRGPVVDPIDIAPTVDAETALRSLQQHYQFQVERPESVVTYLSEHPSLGGLLRDAAVAIRHVFPPGHAIYLSIHSDPEGESSDQLFVTVGNRLSVEEAADRFDVFAHTWWRERANDLPSTLYFDVQ